MKKRIDFQNNVMGGQFVKLMRFVLLAITLNVAIISCSKSDDVSLPPEETIMNISLDQTSLKMNVGDEQQLNVIGAKGQSISWSSSDPAIATVGDGVVTTRKGGKAVITAKVGNAQATCSLNIAPDVFIAGYQYNPNNVTIRDIAFYWKNGVAIPLTDGRNFAVANAIYVDGEDIYVSGNEDSTTGLIAMLWKNGQAIPLGNGSNKSVANDIVVVDGDVHVVGKENGRAMYWKNGIGTVLPDVNGVSEAKAVFIYEGDVYIAGFYGDQFDLPVAVYWKNGNFIPLANSGEDSGANDIFVHEGDVHITGYKNNRLATHWINGTVSVLSAASNYAAGHTVLVDGDDVYIAGHESSSNDDKDRCRIWKNGMNVTATFLTEKRSNSTTGFYSSIFVWDKDVHIIDGWNTDVFNIGLYWKNGLIEPVESNNLPIFNDLFVR
tara:strand:+ start:4044 stop:5351 length:1308 start_codon:yes stop_codon:yes gene_type:complete